MSVLAQRKKLILCLVVLVRNDTVCNAINDLHMHNRASVTFCLHKGPNSDLFYRFIPK